MAHKEIQSNYDINTVLTLKVANAIIASSTTTTGTPYIPMTNSQGIAFVITAADANLAGAVTVKVLEATATGTGLKTATAVTSTTFGAGTTSANTTKVLEVEASDLDVANAYDHVTLQVTTAGADSVCVSTIRGPNRYNPL